ncbi:MAG: pimelyl-ACP methyl ester esterase BioV [Sulfurimonas sp.]|uniref:pimelyl-ACP methyl ester esterase BioV n=1 Tax=Sulfurimonas sp. TaxID=2022749 RepID=UPI0025DB11E3|nr:pimelyl-ACP methyl ester esterase BioV [Sulfurimonas sp.]MCK9490523.1 pimelyl-ACP methyl ester esterase BioV [Sulfurimonas sp.]
MQFFSGFSLQNENYLFKGYINDTKYTVAGFSYGSIKALEYVKKTLAAKKRVDTLQLLSPTFFQTRDTKFKRLQILSFTKSEIVYMKQFIKLCFDPYEKKIVEQKKSTKQELEELLNYEWDFDELDSLAQQGVKLEVYLGEKDKIIDVEGAREFFTQVASVTYIKNANHFLQIS